jgi:hypothetical protein
MSPSIFVYMEHQNMLPQTGGIVKLKTSRTAHVAECSNLPLLSEKQVYKDKSHPCSSYIGGQMLQGKTVLDPSQSRDHARGVSMSRLY